MKKEELAVFVNKAPQQLNVNKIKSMKKIIFVAFIFLSFQAVSQNSDSQYRNNSLSNGAMPYSYCYGTNRSCTGNSCSQIQVTTPNNSDVVVTIKKAGEVVRHAYIRAGSTYTFNLPNGTYQPFFYYGKGWNPNKFMKQAGCGAIKGGFVTGESFGKDDPVTLYNQILTYELIIQQNGNFTTRPSNKNDAF